MSTALHRQLRAERRRRPLLRTWLLAFAALFVASAAWSLASPLGSAPDGPAHILRAAAVVRGQMTGKPLPLSAKPGTKTYKELQNLTSVTVPEVFADLGPYAVGGRDHHGYIPCFQFAPKVPAGCAPKLSTSRREVTEVTYVGNYPPLYYYIVGFPTLVWVSVTGMEMAGLASCLLASIFLALAVCSVRRSRGSPLLAAGVGVAATPMALFLASVVNPSGFEISTAISAWAAGMALWSTPPDEVRRSHVAILGVSLAALALSRSLGPVWVAAILVVLGLLGFRGRWRGMLFRFDVWAWAALAGLAALATAIWDVAEHGFRTEPGVTVPLGTSIFKIFGGEVDRLSGYVNQSIGVFGWLTTPSPYGVEVAWLFCLGALLFVACSSGSARKTLTALAVVAGWAVFAVGTGMASARSRGFVGQGRDFLALGVAVPIVSAALASGVVRVSVARRLVRNVVVVVVVAQVVDFYWALRRYMVGSAGPVDLFVHVKDAWTPPLPAAVLIVAFVAAAVTYGGLLWPRPYPLESSPELYLDDGPTSADLTARLESEPSAG